jgi:O-antigen/teichoic acid export membrane protein/glycosyltransferase involved in cell wall biosynthesis
MISDKDSAVSQKAMDKSASLLGIQPAENSDKHFKTDHLLENLESRSVSGGFITGASQGVQFVLTLASTMILARILTPRDFGLVAMVWTLMGLLRIFRDAGLSTATVQRDGINHTQVSNLFWVNVGVSGFASLMVAASAPLVAWFYRDQRLVGITLSLSPIFLMAGLAVQHMALLNRQMRFKVIALIQVGSVLAGVLAGVGMAWFKCGYWALVGMNLTTSLVALVLTWVASSWRPQFFKARSGTRSLLHFGANVTAGTFLYSLARGLDGLLIGRFCGAVPLGLYSRAAAMLARPLEQFIAPIQAVVIPAFSRLQSQPERYRQNFMRLYESIALTSFFFTGMFFALARPLTLVVLGPKWEGAAIIFAALSFAALQAPLGSCASWLITSQGRGKDSFSTGWMISFIVAVSYIVGLPWGPAGVAIAYAAFCLAIQIPVYYWLVGRSGPVSAGDLWIGFLKHLPVWGIVTLVAWLTLNSIPNMSPLWQLAVSIPASLAAGVAFIVVYPPSRQIASSLVTTVRQIKRPARDIRPKGESSQEATLNRAAVAVSVIIPTYNRAPFVVKAVESVLRQTFRDFEIIVIDDGSSDGTRFALGPCLAQIKYIFQLNSGVSAARNAGIAAAAGKWIAFLDSDDEWSPDFLARQMQAISQNPDVCMQISDCRYSDQTGEKKSYFETNGTLANFNGSNYLRPKEPFVFLLRHLSWQVGAAIVRKDVIERAGLFDPNFSIGEDQDFLARVTLQGPVGLIKDKLMTAYRRTEPLENLSKVATANPICSRILHDGLFRKLESINGLNRSERRTMKWLRSANYRAIGNLFSAEGKIQEARNAYWMAVKIQPSLASVGRYFLSFFGRPSNQRPPATLELAQTAKE